jgi:branched-chain amino acid transport system permease protein
MGIYYFFYKPIFKKSGSGLVVFITSLALTIIGENLLSLAFKADPKQLPQNLFTNPIKFNNLIFSLLDITTILYAIFVLILVIYFLNHTKIGRMTKATASDPELALSKGIDIEKIYLFTYGFGSLLVMPVGILIGLRGSITPGMGSSLNLIGVMAVIFGGIGNPIGAFIAAIVLGVIRNISLLVIDASWLSTITFGLFLLVIVIWPKGILGERNKN